MAATVLSPPLHTTQEQIRLSSPPADKFGSSHIPLLPAYTNRAPKQTSTNRYSWSSASSNNSAASPTSPENGTTPTRKFRLPVRVSTDLTSFASSDSSPQSRRRSLSLASDTKRRSSQIPALKKVEEDKKGSAEKSTPKSPEKAPSKEEPAPPPPYRDTKSVSDSKDSAPPPPTYENTKKNDIISSKPTEKAFQKNQETLVPSPGKAQNLAPQQPPTKMSSAASSPDAQKTAMANPMGNRGLDFSVGNGNTKLTHQSDHGGSLPLPNLSGRGNGPVGNLLRGPVDEEGNLKAAALTVGIKLDLEAEVHLSARVRGDILVGLY